MRLATIIVALLPIGGMAQATTWHVSQDGSGDFVAIQDAIDAASAGDEIWVHAGRYDLLLEDYDVYGDGSGLIDLYVAITKDDLTLRGDGADVTIIGPETFPDDAHAGLTGVNITHSDVDMFTMQDVSVENVRYGVFADNPSLQVTDCRFEGTRNESLMLYTPGGCDVSGCEFLECQRGVVALFPSQNVRVTDCRFVDGIVGATFLGDDGAVVDGCEFERLWGCVSLQQGATGLIRNCSMLDSQNWGISITLGASAEITGCRIEGGGGGLHSGAAGGWVTVTDCDFVGQSYAAFDLSASGPITVTQSNIINGGGYSVYCNLVYNDDCTADFRNNYWGTDSEAQIAEWIYDTNDHPTWCCVVEFIPFEVSTAVESRSWSDVKGLFKGSGE